MSDATTQGIEARITAYLSAGGLFNPELIEHEKVRDLLLDCREQSAQQAEQIKQLEAQIKALNFLAIPGS